MGYPMTYKRVVSRNHLIGGYGSDPLSTIAGDLRRLEADTLDPLQLEIYSVSTGCTNEQVKKLFTSFFYNIVDELTTERYLELYHSFESKYQSTYSEPDAIL